MIKPVVKIKQTAMYANCSSNSGNFAVSTFNGKFFTYPESHQCREVFAGYFTSKTNFIIFNKSNVNIERINDFFERIEEKLQLKVKTNFAPSNFKNAILVEVSPFWTDNALKRGMFTLFLRCAGCYYTDDVYKALLKYPLTRKIIGPIEWFMKGNTNISKKIGSNSIVNELYLYSKKDWELTLTK